MFQAFTSKCCPRTLVWDWVTVTTPASHSPSSNSVSASCILPDSILDISNTSLISPSSSWEELAIFCRHSITFLLSFGEQRARLVRPITAFKGVRMSWLMLAKKVLLAAPARSSFNRASSRRLRDCTLSVMSSSVRVIKLWLLSCSAIR